MDHRAILDAAGVYQGVEEVETLVAGDVPVPADCDLPAGKYVWLGYTFMPLSVIKTALDNGGAQ
jgi:hypothetical protein